MEKQQAYLKIQSYCAYQERCSLEAYQKLQTYDISESDCREILAQLVAEEYINDARFAKAYLLGKLRKQWGLQRIRRELQQRQIPTDIIEQVVDEVYDEQAYTDQLLRTLEKKKPTIKAANNYELSQKLAAFAYQKGFEMDAIRAAIKQLLANN